MATTPPSDSIANEVVRSRVVAVIYTVRYILTSQLTLSITPSHETGIRRRAGLNGIDIEVSRHHTVSVSNFQSIKLSIDDWMVYF